MAQAVGRHISSHRITLIGRNRHGHWVVRDRDGLHGGLFVKRAEALRYALSENGGARNAVVMVPDGLELYPGPGANATR
ncbi:MAG: hypothetical protein AB7K04_10150 [Pseudorhodoplanes sp.]